MAPSPLTVFSFSIPFLLFFGLYTGEESLLFLGGTFVFLVGAAWAFGTESALQLTVKRRFHPQAFEKGEAELRIEVRNGSGFPLLGPHVIDRFSAQDLLPKNVLLPKDIPPHTSIEISYRTLCLRHRGIYEVGPVQVRFSDPLGLFERIKKFPATAQFTVLPTPLPIADLGLDGRSTSFSVSTPDRHSRGQSLKFYGVREYRPGDPLRFMHWKASARLGSFVVRQFEADVSAQISVFLDLARESLAGTGAESTVEYGVRAAAAIARASIAQGHEVQLIAEGDRSVIVPLGSGETHLGYLLGELATIKPRGKKPLSEVLRENVFRVPQGSQVYLIVGTIHQEPASYAEPLAFLYGRRAAVRVLLLDDRTFVQHHRWRTQTERRKMPELARFFLLNGAEVTLVARGADISSKLEGTRGSRKQ